VAGGLIGNKRKRDAETPAEGGLLRDVGITAAGVSAGSLALQANDVISCASYGMEQPICNAAHGAMLIVGFVMYWIGVTRTKKPIT
jgi:hypothetical protein